MRKLKSSALPDWVGILSLFEILNLELPSFPTSFAKQIRHLLPSLDVPEHSSSLGCCNEGKAELDIPRTV